MRGIITFEYETYPEHYSEEDRDPRRIAEIDAQDIGSITSFDEFLESAKNVVVKIEPA